MKPLAPAIVAEFIGTFALCFFGIGAIANVQMVGLIGIALSHGLALSVFICACMYISGAQFNPAVSIGLIVAGKQTPARAGVFIVAQVIGAVCGTWAIAMLAATTTGIGAIAKAGATSGLLTDMGFVGRVMGFEALCTFALMVSVLGATVDDRAHRLGGFVIGLTVTMCILVAGPYTGASMNPARTLGPAIVGGKWTMWYAYMIGPIVGASVAAVVYRLFWVDRWSKPT
ncbi:MAG: aquaporin [Phycisphaerales bacterium]